MKTKLITIVLFVFAGVIGSPAQTSKQKQTTSATEVTILYENERQIYYIAEKVSGKFIKLLPYKEVYQFDEGMALVKTDKSIGFINQSGVEVVPPNDKYQWAESFSNGLALVGTKDMYGNKKSAGFVNKSGAVVIPLNYQEAKSFSENLAPVKKNNKWGYINKTGTVIIPFQYKDAYTFSEGLAIAGTEKSEASYNKKLYGFIDKTGKTIIPFKYTFATYFHKSPTGACAIVKNEDSKYLLINKLGKTLSNFECITEGNEEDKYPIAAEWLNDNDIKLTYGGGYSKKYGIYNLKNGFKLKPEYTEITNLEHNGQYLVEKDYTLKGVYGNKEIVPINYDFIFDRDSLYFAVYGGEETDNGIKDGKFTLYNYAGKKITKYDDKESYDETTVFSEGLSQVKRNGKYGFINKMGEEVIPLEYDSAGIFSSGIAIAYKEGKSGAINKKNEIVIPFEYDQLGVFVDGFAFYQAKKMVGIIDKTGKKITEPIFDGANSFSEGLASFMKEGKVGFTNTKGEIIIPPTYTNAGSFSENLAAVSKNNKVGFIDHTGNEIIPIKYDKVWNFKNGYAIVLEGENYSLIDKKGNVVKSY